jgi:hypothetical protein
MKKSYLYLMACAMGAMFLASCSEDSTPAGGGGDSTIEVPLAQVSKPKPNPFKLAVADIKIRHAIATHAPHILGRSRSKCHQIHGTAPCHLTLGKIDIESSILDFLREGIRLSRIEVRNTILFLCKPRVRLRF